jgi:hypothetical protein
MEDSNPLADLGVPLFERRAEPKSLREPKRCCPKFDVERHWYQAERRAKGCKWQLHLRPTSPVRLRLT